MGPKAGYTTSVAKRSTPSLMKPCRWGGSAAWVGQQAVGQRSMQSMAQKGERKMTGCTTCASAVWGGAAQREGCELERRGNPTPHTAPRTHKGPQEQPLRQDEQEGPRPPSHSPTHTHTHHHHHHHTHPHPQPQGRTEAPRNSPSARMNRKNSDSPPTTRFSSTCPGDSGPPPYTCGAARWIGQWPGRSSAPAGQLQPGQARYGSTAARRRRAGAAPGRSAFEELPRGPPPRPRGPAQSGAVGWRRAACHGR